MNFETATSLRVGDWRVNPTSCEISRGGKTVRLDFRAMQLLVCLAERAGEVVSIDELLNQVWQGVIVSPDSVYQAVTSLRRQLGDDSRNPSYIATVPRIGYRMVAAVGRWQDAASVKNQPLTVSNSPQDERSSSADSGSIRRSRRGLVIAGSATLCLGLFFVAFLLRGSIGSSRHLEASSPSQPPKSIAVLPFLDLTEGMHEETFADGMTEELIDRLSKVRGLQVPPATSSFFYKGKQIAVAEVAKALGVAYVLDGSVRESGDMVRVAARLVRADNGYIMWSETYDRSFHDILMVQDDIASAVTRALIASIGDAPENSK